MGYQLPIFNPINKGLGKMKLKVFMWLYRRFLRIGKRVDFIINFCYYYADDNTYEMACDRAKQDVINCL